MIAHAPRTYHAPCQPRGFLKVVLRTRGDISQREFLRAATAQGHSQALHQVAARIVAPVILWQELGDTKRASAWHNRHFVHRIDIGQDRCYQCVPAFMVGHDPALPFIHQGFPLASQQQFVERILEVLAIHLRLASPCRSQRRLVHQICQVCS